MPGHRHHMKPVKCNGSGFGVVQGSGFGACSRVSAAVADWCCFGGSGFVPAEKGPCCRVPCCGVLAFAALREGEMGRGGVGVGVGVGVVWPTAAVKLEGGGHVPLY